MTTPDLKSLREAAEAATPGPWVSYGGTTACRATVGSEGGCIAMLTTRRGHGMLLARDATQMKRDAAFIALANPQAVLALLAEHTALLARLDAVEADARRYRYLRQHHTREWVSDMPHDRGAPSLSIDFDAPGHDLDAAIDAALQDTQP